MGVRLEWIKLENPLETVPGVTEVEMQAAAGLSVVGLGVEHEGFLEAVVETEGTLDAMIQEVVTRDRRITKTKIVNGAMAVVALTGTVMTVKLHTTNK